MINERSNTEHELIDKLLLELSPSQIDHFLKGLDKKQLSDILIRKLLDGSNRLIRIPVSIFSNKELGFLETLVYYLKTQAHLRNKQISILTGRSSQVVWTAYSLAKSKVKSDLPIKESQYDFFISVIQDNCQMSIFECIAYHLRNSYNLTYNELSAILNRCPSTISTIYNRAKSKIQRYGKDTKAAT